MKNRMHDIIIVGSGPVGGYTAYLLAKEGFDVGIFEKNPFIGKDINCTGIISAECLNKLDLGSDVVVRPIHSIRAVSPSENSLRYQSVTPLAYVVDRSLFDTKMNSMAVREGATTYLNSKVVMVDISDSAFKIKVKSDGREQIFSSKTGVIASGFEVNSFRGMIEKPKNILFGAQTDVEMCDVDDVEVYFGKNIAPGSFGWVVPTSDKSAKVGLIAKKNPAGLLGKFLQNPLISSRLGSFAGNIKCSPIPVRRVPKSYAERLVIVGEAAGQVKATTGGGIYFGLLCAEIAAGTIIKAFGSGDFSEKMFKEYESAWRKKLDPELRAGIMLRNIFSKLSDNQIDFLMDLAKRDGVLPLIQKAHFDWHRDLISYLIRHLIKKNLFS
jgi:digeranylgeranylglycerophospholipid reductase